MLCANQKPNFSATFLYIKLWKHLDFFIENEKLWKNQ
jgi:hypothetical protein